MFFFLVVVLRWWSFCGCPFCLSVPGVVSDRNSWLLVPLIELFVVNVVSGCHF